MTRVVLIFAFLLGLYLQLQAATRYYRCIWNDDPATTMTIAFDQYSGTLATVRVHYDTAPQGGVVANYANSTVPYTNNSYKNFENVFVKLTGLTPNTRYYFVVVDDDSVSSEFFFETAPNVPTERLAFIAGGDSRDVPDILTGGVDDEEFRQNANRMVAALRPHGVFFGGDMTLTDDELPVVIDSEWVEWFEDWQLTIAADGRMTPIVVARGNHEYNANSIKNFFDTPNVDDYYALTFGGGLLRAYTLNTEISILGNQLTWMQADFPAHNTTWKIVQYHRPIRPHHADKDEQNDMAEYWVPIFEDNGVQLVIECDAHLSKYTYPVQSMLRGSGNATTKRSDEGFLRNDREGIVYIGEGGWGAELRDNDDDKGWTMASGSFNQVKWIFIDQNQMEIRTVKTDNVTAVTPKVDADSKFTMPVGIDIWNPTPPRPVEGIATYNNGVLTLTNPN